MTEEEWLTTTTMPKKMMAEIRPQIRPRRLLLITAKLVTVAVRSGFNEFDGLGPATLAAFRDVEQHMDDPTDNTHFLDIQERISSRFPHLGGPQTNRDMPPIVHALVHYQPGNGATLVFNHMEQLLERIHQWDVPRETWLRFRQFTCDLIRELVGNPFRPWKVVPDFLGGGRLQPDGATVPVTPTALALADGIYAEQAFDRLPILADALEESGVTDPELLAHCRTGTGHVRGCWALDVVRGKV